MKGAACCALACAPACSTSAAAAPSADRVFVSQAGSSTVALVDATTGTVDARIEVGMLPHNLVLSPDGRALYAVLVGSQAIAEIDVAGGRLRRTMLTAPVPDRREDGSIIQPHIDQDAFSHDTCYDCHRPDRAQPKYAGERPFGLLLSPDGRHLYVSHLRSSRLAILNLDSGEIERSTILEAAGTAIEAVALARMGDPIWVALRPHQPSTLPGALRRLDASTLAPMGDDITTGADPGALLALPNRARVLVSNFETDTVSEHDDAGNVVSLAAAPGPLGLLALPSHQVLALDYYSNAVSFLDFDAGTSQTLPLEYRGATYVNPTHAALSSDGQSAWIVSSGTDGHLLEMNLVSQQIVRDVSIDGLSFGVAVVPGNLR